MHRCLRQRRAACLIGPSTAAKWESQSELPLCSGRCATRCRDEYWSVVNSHAAMHHGRRVLPSVHVENELGSAYCAVTAEENAIFLVVGETPARPSLTMLRPSLRCCDRATLATALTRTALAITLAGCGPHQRSPTGKDNPRTVTSTPARIDAHDAIAPTSPDRVAGTVIEVQSHAPLAGRTVAIGGRQTITDANGTFVFDDVARVYDVTIVEPGAATATCYQGLSRRDPILVHKRLPPKQYPEGTLHAELHGSLTGGGPYPLATDSEATIYLLSPEVQEHVFLGGRLYGPERGPGFTLRPWWISQDPMSGTLFAVRTNGAAFIDNGAPDGSPASASDKWWFGQRPVTIKNGEITTANLTLASVSSRRFAVHVNAPRGHHPVLGCEYRISSMRAGFITPQGGCALRDPRHPYSPDTWWDCEVAALPIPGATLCVWDDNGAGESLATRRCDIADGVVLPLTLQPAPSLTMPTDLSVWTKDTRFAWTPFDHGIYRLALEDKFPTPDNPSVDVYTAETTAVWPDLSALGLIFPKGSAEYYVKILGLGPYSTMDDATGVEGIGAFAPGEMRGSRSADYRLIVQPEPLPQVGPTCKFPYMTAIVCGHDSSNRPNEEYMLAAINNQLRRYPQFAAAIGISCVRDCAGARAWAKAYEKYAREHPAFDANEPVDEPRLSLLPPVRSARPVKDSER
jgi:hypothetical protein